MEKFCFVIPLKWGMLIIAIIDTILDVLGSVALYYDLPFEGKSSMFCALGLFVNCSIIHLMGCIFIVLTIWVQNRIFLLIYGVSGGLRLGFSAWIIAFGLIYWWILSAIIQIIIFVFGIYFMVCVVFWYYKHEN
ncbi:hypothetical protein ACLKA6_016390 [Drosophila palustris]